MDHSLLQVSVFAEALSGIQAALRAEGLNLLLAEAPRPDELPPMLARGDVQGVILLGVEPPDTVAATLRRYPVVRVFPPENSGPWGDQLGPDETEIGRLAADYLLRTGHRHVAFFNPEPFHPAMRPRSEAFRRTILAAGAQVEILEGVAVQPPTPLRVFLTQTRVTTLLDRWLALTPRPTAMLVGSDLVASMVYRALAERGLRPGQDLAVVSNHDEKRLWATLEPRPAAVDIGAQTLGRRAVDQLLWRIRNPEQARMRILIQPSLEEP
jgi:LacI family transcriptional regulator